MKGCSEKKSVKINKKLCRYYYSALQKLCEKIHGHGSRGGKVFLFHQVNDDTDMWKDADCAISKKGFEEFIFGLCDEDVEFGFIDELMGTGYVSKVFLTFDDIYNDTVEYAMPILKEKGIPFCVFISDCYIGRDGYISEEQLAGLAREPLCTIGYHTKSHGIMRHMPEKEVMDEVKPDSLEAIIGRKINCFAYPYGSFYAVSKRNVRTVKEAGYGLAFSTVRMVMDDEIRRKYDGFLPRINVNESNYTKYIINT